MANTSRFRGGFGVRPGVLQGQQPSSNADARKLGLLSRDLQQAKQERLIGEAYTNDTTYFVGETDDIVFADATNNNVSVALPPAAANQGRQLTVVRVDGSANGVTVRGNDSTETINGSLTRNLATLYATVTIYAPRSPGVTSSWVEV